MSAATAPLPVGKTDFKYVLIVLCVVFAALVAAIVPVLIVQRRRHTRDDKLLKDQLADYNAEVNRMQRRRTVVQTFEELTNDPELFGLKVDTPKSGD